MCSRGRDAVRVREVTFDYRKGPSFSSTLLEHIYRTIDGDDAKDHHGMRKQQEKNLHDDAAHRANLLDRWMMDKKNKNYAGVQNSRPRPVAAAAVGFNSNKNAEPLIDKNLHYIDNDPLFFSSGSNSSDSNSSLFSDHDPFPVVLPTTKTRSSCFLPPKPIRTTVKDKKSSGAKTERHHCSQTERDDDVPASAKSRALNLYSHLKKMKQPISPGVKLTTFINSYLSKSNTNNHSNRGSATASAAVKPTCSSASSFTRTNYSVRPSLVKLAPVNVRIKTGDAEVSFLSVKRDGLRPQLNRASNPKATSKISVGRVSEDARSDCSEDLFELDHLKLSSINASDLPVVETKRCSSSSNRNHKNRVLVITHSDC